MERWSDEITASLLGGGEMQVVVPHRFVGLKQGNIYVAQLECLEHGDDDDDDDDGDDDYDYMGKIYLNEITMDLGPPASFKNMMQVHDNVVARDHDGDADAAAGDAIGGDHLSPNGEHNDDAMAGEFAFPDGSETETRAPNDGEFETTDSDSDSDVTIHVD